MHINKSIIVLLSCLSLSSLAYQGASDQQKNQVQPNLAGIEIPAGYKDWRVISASHRIDNKSIRIILGNDIAIDASRNGETNPWPDGTILGKLVWKQTSEEHWPTAIAPGEFVHAEFMYKDSEKYNSNGTNWGWARWLGKEQKPYGDDNDLDQSCIACHAPVKGKDWVFTTPIELP